MLTWLLGSDGYNRSSSSSIFSTFFRIISSSNSISVSSSSSSGSSGSSISNSSSISSTFIVSIIMAAAALAVLLLLLSSSISGVSNGFVLSASAIPIDRDDGPGAVIETHTGNHADDDSISLILALSLLSAAFLRNWVRNA